MHRWAMEAPPPRRNRAGALVILLCSVLLGLFLSGCVVLRDPESSLDYSGDVVATLKPGAPLTQAILSRRSGLNGVQLWLRKASSEAADTDILTFRLYHANENGEPLVSVPIAYSRLARSFPVEAKFPPLDDPPNQRYVIQLETEGGPVSIYGRSEDVYPEGDFAVAGVPQQADLAFRTSYRYGLQEGWGDLALALRRSWLIFPLLLLLWLPGMLVLEVVNLSRASGDSPSFGKNERAWFKPHQFLMRWDWSERNALALGLSMSLTPLVLLWTTTLGLRFSQPVIIVVGIVIAATWLALVVRRKRRGEILKPPDGIDLALLLVLVFTLGMRLVMVRDLAAPAWVDPVHHTTIARLIYENGAYPASYLPYIETGTASYHPGFHALSAILHGLTGLEMDRAILLLGQVMNGVFGLAVYLLATTLTRSRPAGLAAAVICGFLTPMPAYYTSWGRYTQLAGLLILPVCAAFLIQLLEVQVFRSAVAAKSSSDPDVSPGSSQSRLPLFSGGIRLLLLAALTGAGLFMVHYRVVAFLALLMIAFFTGELIRSLNKRPLWETIPRSFVWLATAVLLAILLSLPWWPNLWQSLLQPRLAQTAQLADALKINWGYLIPAFGKASLWLALAGLALSLLQARWFGPVLALWIGLLFISANQGVVVIPGAGNINLTSVEIMLFMPVAVLGGYALGSSLSWIARILAVSYLKPFYGLLAVGTLALGLAGARRLIPILNPVTLLFREADRPAMNWIAQNVPPEETVLINPFLWGYGNYAGQDGGYWITPIAGRKTFPPNLLYAMRSRAEVVHVNQTSQKVIDLAGDPAGLRALLLQEGIRYVYLGRRGGVLSAQKLQQSGLFEPLYQQDGTWVFLIPLNGKLETGKLDISRDRSYNPSACPEGRSCPGAGIFEH